MPGVALALVVGFVVNKVLLLLLLLAFVATFEDVVVVATDGFEPATVPPLLTVKVTCGTGTVKLALASARPSLTRVTKTCCAPSLDTLHW